ncbi:hypothetical protein C2S53_010580 [Perilla frutescens var. hirtella]|uniref:Uncharacterized protein n=1 Tax=Perilla frutescens var. hirtella TaxID=608512 RepID=A0AAD4JD63_PERFH|nr:hypothetical protein C2S53_010580 [Perilla frutescens var. hirtella]
MYRKLGGVRLCSNLEFCYDLEIYVKMIDEPGASIDDSNPELQLRGPVTRLRAKKLQGYLHCYVGKKLEDVGADFKQSKLVTVLSIEELD